MINSTVKAILITIILLGFFSFFSLSLFILFRHLSAELTRSSMAPAVASARIGYSSCLHPSIPTEGERQNWMKCISRIFVTVIRDSLCLSIYSIINLSEFSSWDIHWHSSLFSKWTFSNDVLWSSSETNGLDRRSWANDVGWTRENNG